MNRSRPPRRCASTTCSAPHADTMAGRAESGLRSSTAPTQDYDDIVEVLQAPTDLAMARVRATDNFEERESPSEMLAGHLRDKVDKYRLYTSIRPHHALAVLDDADEEEKKKEAQGQAGSSAARFLHVRRE